MPPGAPVYSGTGFARVKVVHPLDQEAGAKVGPAGWTLKVGASIQEATKKFGHALQTNAGTRDRLLSDSAVSGADLSDTAKVLVHFFWRTPSLGIENTFCEYTSPGETAHKFRFFRASPTGFFMRWHRATDFTAFNETIQMVGSESGVSVDTFHSIVGFMNANSITEGKILVDGVDVTGVISAIDIVGPVATTGFDSMLLGNHEAGFNVPARFMDHFTLLQGSDLTDSVVLALAAKYENVRGFGHFPEFVGIIENAARPFQTITLIGAGFGPDVKVQIDGRNITELVVVDDGTLTFKIPAPIEPGEYDVTIENVLAQVTVTIPNGIEVAAVDEEELIQILRGARGGTAHPIGKLIVIDEDGVQTEIETEVKRIQIVLRRDDRRMGTARLVPPIQSLDLILRNDQRQFTRGFGGIFDGLILQGRRVLPFLGVIVKGIKKFKQFGEFRVDDPNFGNSPPAVLTVQCRDLLSAALDQEISMRSFTGRADEYIKEVLAKVGIITEGVDAEISLLTTTLTFSGTTVIEKEKAIDILSELLARLQTEANYRLIQDSDGIIKLIIVPSSGLADQGFHWKNDIKAPYNQLERANQSSLRTTVTKVEDPTVTADVLLDDDTFTEADFSGSPKQMTIAFSKAIRIEWRQNGDETQDFEVKEVARTTTSLTLEMINALDTGTINILIRGDTTSVIAGEAGSGEDQGGVGLGNEINRKRVRRGQARDVPNRFVNNDGEAQAVADILQQRFGDPASEQDYSLWIAPLATDLNDLVRIIEKFSISRSLHTVSQIVMTLQAGEQPGTGDRLDGRIIAQDAGIDDPAFLYDSGFKYDAGLIYDDRFPIGSKEDEDTSFRGAVVTKN